VAGRGFGVTFSVPEIKDAVAKIGTYDTKTAAKVEQAIANSTGAIAKGAKSRVPVKTGKLKKKISSQFDRGTLTGRVAAKTSYAHLVEFGAKAASVKPVQKKALLFKGGYSAKANVPARTEHPYMRPSFEQEKPNLIRNVKEAVKP